MKHWLALSVTAGALLCACPSTDYSKLYASSPLAPSLTSAKVEALDTLGPTIIDRGINFSVYSEHAERIEVLVFENPEADRPTRQFPMTRFGDVWNVYVEGVGVGTAYGYIAWGPNWPYDPEWIPGSIKGFVADVDDQGNRFNPNKLLFDPYGKALTRDHDWSRGSTASGPSRQDVTYGAAAKSLVVKSTYAWSESEALWRQNRQDAKWVGHAWNDVILYEVHLKGLTASPASGVQHPGTYLGAAEKAEYLKSLGITAVEFLPVHEKPVEGGYWGYQTLSFFAPENTYSFRKQNAEIIDEFKGMVDAFHKQGIEVILDVVYNHTGEGGYWRNTIEFDVSPDPRVDDQLAHFDPREVAGIVSYRGLDNQAYYALTPDKVSYWNNAGVGQQTRANHRPVRRLIMDSLRYYVEEMHVDGFRFDLAPVLGEKNNDYSAWDDPKNTVLQEIADDPVLQKYNTRIYSEPWAAGGYDFSKSYNGPNNNEFANGYGTRVGLFPNSTNRADFGWGEWNGRFRDWWRSFANQINGGWTFNSREVQTGGFFLTASSDWFKWNGRKPYHSVNFVTVHDGFTMYDLFSYDMKQNKCGPLNTICCDAPFSPFCDRDSGESHNRSYNWSTAQNDTLASVFNCNGNMGDNQFRDQCVESGKRQLMRDLFTAMLISHGTPMLFGGDEWMRTQLGNNNAYSSGADNSFNWFDWGSWQSNNERQRMHDFVKELIQFRKDHAYALSPADWSGPAPFAWKGPSNTDANDGDWNSKRMMLHYYDKTKGPELAILINMEGSTVEFTLPEGRQWARVIDTQAYFDRRETLMSMSAPLTKSLNITRANSTVLSESKYGVMPRSIVVLEAK